MQIDKEILSEKNYTGSRLIEINDDLVIGMKKELDTLQREMSPLLEEIKPEWDKLDESFPSLKKAQDELKKVQDERSPILEKCRKFEEDFLKPIEQKAQLIKNKVQPIALSIVKDQLGEFETAQQIVDRDGKIFIEVVDSIEEHIKKIRAQKN